MHVGFVCELTISIRTFSGCDWCFTSFWGGSISLWVYPSGLVEDDATIAEHERIDRKRKRYKQYERIGLGCLIAGFTLQLIPSAHNLYNLWFVTSG